MLLRRVRTFVALLALVEVVVFVLVATQIGVGWTILAMLGTSALGGMLLARQGTRALLDLRQRARERQPAGRELGDTGLVAVGGLLMLLPGFVGDLLGLLCLLPGTRGLVRRALARLIYARLPVAVRGPVRVDSTRTVQVDGPDAGAGPGAGGGFRPVEPPVIEGEVVRDDPPS